MCFLFRLDLSLHTGAEKKFRILNYATKQQEPSGSNDQTTASQLPMGRVWLTPRNFFHKKTNAYMEY